MHDSWLTIAVREAHARDWCDEGHEVAVQQLRLDRRPAKLLPAPSGAVRVGDVVEVGPVAISTSGRILRIGEAEVRASGVELWRAPTENDSLGDFGSYEIGDYTATRGQGLPGPSSAARWREHGLDRLLRRTVSAEARDGEFVVVERLLPAQGRHGAEVTYRWRRIGDAAGCQVQVSPIRPRTDVTWPRVGFHLLLPGEYEQAQWFGGGPGEAYPDSRSASIVGRHASAIDDLAFPYAVPQETGHRESLRRLEISGHAPALRLRAFGPDLPGFSLLRHDAHELAAARHQHELPESSGVHLYLDAAQHGLGSRSCGPDVLPQYQLWPRSVSFGFTLELAT